MLVSRCIRCATARYCRHAVTDHMLLSARVAGAGIWQVWRLLGCSASANAAGRNIFATVLLKPRLARRWALPAAGFTVAKLVHAALAPQLQLYARQRAAVRW